LPDAVANQIAAGEVVQRPSNAVKELLENSLDAGATKITLLVKDGGSTLMQVIDNGKGMSEMDARLCWERHATSKIRKAEDLYQLNTYGFRGEAMASIAAVSQVEMKTRRADDEVAQFIRIEGSEVLEQRVDAAPTSPSKTCFIICQPVGISLRALRWKPNTLWRSFCDKPWQIPPWNLSTTTTVPWFIISNPNP